MEQRLVPINGLLGLVTAGDINPPALLSAGFRLAGLEIPATHLADKVVVDVLLFSEETNHLILCESKSGANVEDKQARTYRDLSPSAVVQAAGLTLRSRISPTCETAYVCLAQHQERIRLGLKTAGVQAPVFAVGKRRIDLLDPSYASNALAGALRGGVNLVGPPPRILAFDPESPVETVRRYVQAEMVSMLAQRRDHISLAGLTESVAPHYPLYARKAQQSLMRKVGHAVDAIVMDSPDRFAHDHRVGNRDGLVRFLKTPEDLDPRGRTQAYQALGRPGRLPRARSLLDPNQLDLLRELDLGDNDEEDLEAPGEEGAS